GHREWIIGASEATGVLAQTVIVSKVAQVTQRDVGEHRPLGRTQLAHQGSYRRQVLGSRRRLDTENRILGMGIAGQGKVRADRVMVKGMTDGWDDGVGVRQLGQARQVFGYRDSGHPSGNRDEVATDLFGRVRFEVPDIEVGRAAIVEDYDAGFGSSKRAVT